MPKHVRNDEPEIDRTVRPGDIALDQAQGTWVYVVEQTSPEVAVWNRENDGNLLDYAGNWLCGATLGDRVFAVVYLGGNGVKSAPSGSYDFPESRLARYPAEEANENLRRPQVDVLQRFITRLFERAKTEDFDHETGERSGDLADSIAALAEDILPFAPMDFDRDLAVEILEEADEDAERSFQAERERWEDAQERRQDEESATDGGEDDDSDDEDDVVEADLGTETVDDPDDSDLETETDDETVADSIAKDEDAVDDLDEFEDFDA